MPRRNGKVRGASAFRQGLALNQCYKQTIASQIATFSTNLYNCSELLSDMTGRTVVVNKIMVELLPDTIANSATASQAFMAQLQLTTALTGDPATVVPVAPFKMLSNINPTIFTIDCKQLAKVCPRILAPIRVASTENLLIIQLNTVPNERLITARITTFATVLPDTLTSLVIPVSNLPLAIEAPIDATQCGVLGRDPETNDKDKGPVA